MLSLVVVGILWREVYDPTIGLLNSLLQAIGLGSVAQPWLAQASTARPALIVAASWQSFGYNMVLFLAGLQQVPAEIHEAAMIDGATYWQRVARVTLPLLREVFTIICILTFIGSFRAFDVIYATTTGGPDFATETLAYYVYQIGFFLSNNFGYASTIAVVLFVIIFIPSLFWIRLQTREEVHLGA
jgi:multiple sugar transport system permease protein/raffinose/stachyose/melibiose transport system permease protein